MPHDRIRPKMNKSNALLTPSERLEKKKLRNALKFHRRVAKLETRIGHAAIRNDPIVERSATDELRALLASRGGAEGEGEGDDDDDDDGICHRDDENSRGRRRIGDRRASNVDDARRGALDEVLTIFRGLLSRVDDVERGRVHDERMRQIEKSKDLLRNMTRGTQSSSMFRDVHALRGYARKKFHRRAALLIGAMDKLSPPSLGIAASSTNASLSRRERQELDEQRMIMTLCWEKLRDVGRVCSLGCGPGTDAVGTVSFLRHYFGREGPIECVYMLDYYIDEWKGAILADLVDILVPEYVVKVDCQSCDVTAPMDGDTIERCINSDIFLFSYLLTETRNNWDRFIVHLVDLARVGALFYFAEPTPWQLHRLMSICGGGPTPDVDYSPLNRLRFVWLDSSMHLPNMQKLDGRTGGRCVACVIFFPSALIFEVQNLTFFIFRHCSSRTCNIIRDQGLIQS